VKKWARWTHIFAASAGVIHLVSDALGKTIGAKKPDLYNKIKDALHMLYLLVKDVNETFNDEITAIKTGEPIVIIVEPDVLPDWDDSAKYTIISDIFAVLKPGLEEVISDVGEGSVIASAISKFINDSQKYIDELDKMFKQADTEAAA
ncbi:hypothetical protein ACFL2A_05165, partial [Thermodesulfobacteriota bacterium]